MKKARRPQWAELNRLSPDAVGSLSDLSKDPEGSIQEYLNNMAHLLQGHKTAGGCEHCNADYTMQPHPDIPGVSHITIFHDDGCPVIA